MMNREQRRRQEKEAKRNSRGVVKSIPVNQIKKNEDLKECDQELLDLMDKAYDWKLCNGATICIVDKGLKYLDALCSLRFDRTPSNDKAIVRDTMKFISDFANLFMGLYYKKNPALTIEALQKDAANNGNGTMEINVPVHEDIAPMYGDVTELPSRDRVKDAYARFVVEHGNDLAQLLFTTPYEDVENEEEKIFEVLLLISKKTMQFLPESDS